MEINIEIYFMGGLLCIMFIFAVLMIYRNRAPFEYNTKDQTMTRNNYLLLVIFIFLFNCFSFKTNAQNKINGIVTDSISGEPLPFISIYLKGTTNGTMTDNSGKFSISVPDNTSLLYASSIGYKEKPLILRTGRNNNLRIQLAPTDYKISEVTVKPKKRKYSKKGNPAVDFVKKVISSKNQHNPFNKEYYQFQHTEKIDIAINNFQKEKNKNLLKRYKFLTDYIDTSRLSGKPVLPVSTKELVEDYYFQRSPRIEKRVVIAKKNSGVDEMLPEEGVNQVLGEVFKDVDIYQNNISLFLRPFVSPLSDGATDFYKYYLMDTLIIGGDKCAELAFVPFSSQSPGFTGHLYITLDSTYFVKKVRLNFPKDINLNFIRDMRIDQEFKRAQDGTRLLVHDDMEVEFSVLSLTNLFYARRISTYSNHSFKSPANRDVFKQKETKILSRNATSQPDSFWVKARVDTAAVKGKSVENMLIQLRKDPFYAVSEKVFAAGITGYIETSPKHNKITLGPLYSTISSNTTEGVRLRVGGFTTAELNDHWFGDGYLAYGTVDHKLKYQAGLEYSIEKKKKQANEFPVHSIRASYSYDINRLGQHYYSSADNVLLSLKRLPDDKVTYERMMGLSYNKEFYSQLSYGLDLRYRQEYATRYLPFIETATGNNLNSYSVGVAVFRIRYAPGEKIYQTLTKRYSITRNAPVFSLSHTVAFKGVLGSTFNNSHTELSFQKRFWLSQFGNVNAIFRAGKVWSVSPFPLLIIPNANLSYIVQYDTYSNLNTLEFINDQYVSWDLNYNMNGFILNRIPLIQYLKLREIFSFRGFYGSLDRKNDPAYRNDLLNFPDGSYRMGKDPYMEAGLGVENIFKILRIDYVWRLTYLNHPNIDKTGIRFVLDFGF